MPRKKAAPRKAPEKEAPPPEPKRRGRRKKEAEPQPTEYAAPTEPEPVAPDGPVGPVGPVETETTPEPPAPAEPDPTTAVPPAPAAAVTADEAALVTKYGATHQIVPGSLRYAGGREGWSHKRTVEIACVSCPAVRVVATSDLQWDTTRYCLGCVAAVKRNRRAAKKRAK